MPDATPTHIPVLLDEVLELLNPRPGQTCADATAGLGGHAVAIARRLGPTGRVILNDADAANLEQSSRHVRGVLTTDNAVVPIHGDFADLPRRLEADGIRVDLVLADLGFASNQVDDPGRGLSFRDDGPLDMRLNRATPITAGELVNTLPEQELADLIRRFGEDQHARRIARAIAAARRDEPIETTRRLADVVRKGVPRGVSGSIHPATKTFQALRIAVNDELGSLAGLLRAITLAGEAIGWGENTWLAPEARIAIIAFHSLEDRPVKKCFAGLAAGGLGEVLTPKPTRASEAEIEANPRARSARLRVFHLPRAGGR